MADDYLIQAFVQDDPNVSPPLWEDVCVVEQRTSARDAWERYEGICRDNGFNPEGTFRLVPLRSVEEVASTKVTKYEWRGEYREQSLAILPVDDSEFLLRVKPDAIPATIGEPESIGNDEVVPPRLH